MKYRIETFGSATLYLADCREVLPTLSDVAAVLSDPPYGMKYESGWATGDLWKAGKTITGDSDTSVRDEALALVSCPALIFGTDTVTKPPGTKLTLIWDKGGALGMGDLSLPWKKSTEEIYVLGKGFVGSRSQGNVIYQPPVQSMAKNGRLHPNEKPVALLERLMRWLPPGKVCDPFMGSGSTGSAAIKAGRSFVGIEIEQQYFDVACRRLEAEARQFSLAI